MYALGSQPGKGVSDGETERDDLSISPSRFDREASMPSLRLKPTEGVVGTDVTLIGSGFRPNVGYRIQFEDEWTRPGTTTNRGTFVIQVRVSPLPYGEQDVTAFSQAAQQLAHATFKVLPEVTRVEPTEVAVGGKVTVSGTGFGSAEPITVRLGNKDVPFDQETKTRADGTFTVTFAVTLELASTAPEPITVRGQNTGASAHSREKIFIAPVGR